LRPPAPSLAPPMPCLGLALLRCPCWPLGPSLPFLGPYLAAPWAGALPALYLGPRCGAAGWCLPSGPLGGWRPCLPGTAPAWEGLGLPLRPCPPGGRWALPLGLRWACLAWAALLALLTVLRPCLPLGRHCPHGGPAWAAPPLLLAGPRCLLLRAPLGLWLDATARRAAPSLKKLDEG